MVLIKANYYLKRQALFSRIKRYFDYFAYLIMRFGILVPKRCYLAKTSFACAGIGTLQSYPWGPTDTSG